jgi:WD40 repeat protein
VLPGLGKALSAFMKFKLRDTIRSNLSVGMPSMQMKCNSNHSFLIFFRVLSIDTSPDGKVVFASLADFSIRAFEI